MKGEKEKGEGVMTKAELISYLKQIYNLICGLESARANVKVREQEYTALGNRYALPGRRLDGVQIIICIVILALISFPSFWTVGNTVSDLLTSKREIQNPGMLISILIVLLVLSIVGVGGIVGVYYFRRACLRMLDKRIKEIEEKNEYLECMQKTYAPKKLDEIAKAKREAARYLQTLEKYRDQGILHENYFARKPLVYIIGYLEEGRADNLKEALNLYSDEIHKENMAAEQRAYLEEELEIRRQTQAEVEQLRRDIAEGQAQAQREATVNGIIAAIGTDNAIRARKEIERANGKIV